MMRTRPPSLKRRGEAHEMTSVLERWRTLEKRMREKCEGNRRRRMGVEPAIRNYRIRNALSRGPRSFTDRLLATEPRDADVNPAGMDGAGRRHRSGDGEGRKQQREAQATVHTESMTRRTRRRAYGNLKEMLKGT